MPPRVDFYLLKSPTISASYDFICKLVEKVYKQNHRLYIHVVDQSQAKLIHDALWAFNDISFIPHAIYKDMDAAAAQQIPILIGYADQCAASNELLLNLTTQVPHFYSQFQRVIEVVPSQDDLQQIGRDNYKFYRAQSCEIFTHDLKK